MFSPKCNVLCDPKFWSTKQQPSVQWWLSLIVQLLCKNLTNEDFGYHIFLPMVVLWLCPSREGVGTSIGLVGHFIGL